MKQLWLLVGGNGAGKSTFYRLVLEPLGLPFVNADRLAKLLYPAAAEEHSYEAAMLAEQQRNSLLLSGASFGFETVFSHPSKIDVTARAKALGYTVIMVLIHLEQAELKQHALRKGCKKEATTFQPKSFSSASRDC
jgi:predicted ABC-type ATPase